MLPQDETLYLLFRRIPDRKEPPYSYIELVRGISPHTPTEIETAYYERAGRGGRVCPHRRGCADLVRAGPPGGLPGGARRL